MVKFSAKSIAGICFAILSMPVFAGGYQTNTNQSISFLRNPSQDAAFGISALYNNPANTVFLAPGFHMAIGIMNVHQDRDVTTSYAPFALGAQNNGLTTKTFEGNADAPILPSLQFAYNTKDTKWSFSFAFGLVGGGGKCQYDNGLPSFESAISALSMVASTFSSKDLAGNDIHPFKPGYKFDTFMRGRSYQYGFQFGAARKFTDNLSIYGGVRLIYATNNYFGYVKNIQLMTQDNQYVTARQWISEQHNRLEEYKKIAPAYTAQIDEMHKAIDERGYQLADMTGNIGLNCNQAGWGLTPIIGIDWKINEHWNLAAKFEFKTRLRLKNESYNENTEGHGLDKYNNGQTISEDIPSILTVGGMYSPIKAVRINGGFHYYWDKQATKYGDENKLLSGGTWEITAGAEWDFIKGWTISGGWQTTHYPNTDAYMRDISFVTNSNTFGFGVKWQINPVVAIEAAYFQTLYNTYERTQADYNGLAATAIKSLGINLPTGVSAPQALVARDVIQNTGQAAGTDKFDRTNRVFGVGVTLDF